MKSYGFPKQKQKKYIYIYIYTEKWKYAISAGNFPCWWHISIASDNYFSNVFIKSDLHIMDC